MPTCNLFDGCLHNGISCTCQRLPFGPRGLKFLRKMRHLALDAIPRGLGREMPKHVFHCSSYTSLSHIDLCVGRACAAATFSVPDWLRKHLGPRKSGTRIGGFATPASPTSHSQLIQWKSGSRSRGSFSADRGRYGHGTPDAVPGDRDVAYMSISG